MTKITLVLAMAPGRPLGDVDDRLVLNLSLTGQGQIDPAAYDAAQAPWLATRERANAAARDLEIIRLDDGWALQSTHSLDDPIWAFEGQIYRPGEVVQVRRPNGERLLYRVVASETVPA